MASLRKKYAHTGPSQDEAPVTSPPAAEPPSAVETKPVEPMAESSPAEEAGKNRLRQELRKMENANALQHQQQPPPQPPQQQQQEVPAAVAKFLAENPQYADPNDTIAQGEIYVATLKAGRDGLKW